MTGLLLALPTGRLLSDTLDRLAAAGVDVSAVRADNRRLLVPPEEDNPGFLLVKPADVPVYVEAGCADAGIVGKDVLLETQKNVCELLDLAYGFWRLVVAIPAENRSRWPADMPLSLRIATKYPRLAEAYFTRRGRPVELIYLNGSLELAPRAGLADGIVDLVATGRTLAVNGLVEVEEITRGSARLVANHISFRTKAAALNQLVENLKRVTGQGGGASAADPRVPGGAAGA